MDEKYEDFKINLQGTDFITFKGLLAMAHDSGLESIHTEIVSIDRETITEEKDDKIHVRYATGLVMFKAIVSGTKGTYTAFGDGSPKSVKRHLHPAIIRMAETRAIARALRWYTGFGYTCDLELGEE